MIVKKITIMTLLMLGIMVVWAGPKIKVKNSMVDFGEVEDGKYVDFVFEFENIGDADLKIVSINPTCGCSTAQMTKMEYKPGEKGVLPVKFNSAGYNGRVVKSIGMATNDPENGGLQLRFSGNVVQKNVPIGEMKPDSINIGKSGIDKSVTYNFELINTGSTDLRVIESTHGPEVYLEFPTKVVKPQQKITFKLTFRGMEKGPFNHLVRIRTNDPRNPYKIVRLDAQVE
jgi:hypothetical protein